MAKITLVWCIAFITFPDASSLNHVGKSIPNMDALSLFRVAGKKHRHYSILENLLLASQIKRDLNPVIEKFSKSLATWKSYCLYLIGSPLLHQPYPTYINFQDADQIMKIKKVTKELPMKKRVEPLCKSDGV